MIRNLYIIFYLFFDKTERFFDSSEIRIPQYLAALLLGQLLFFNYLTIYLFIKNNGYKFLSIDPMYTVPAGILYLVIIYLTIIKDGKYLRLVKNFKKRGSSFRISWILIAIVYLLLSVLMLIVVT